MFDNLSGKLQRVFKNLRGEGELSAENMDAALREIRVALLEADVHFRVVKRPQGHGSSTLPVRTTESI
jgi:signal recognition particle subunit SRP54